VFKGIKNNTDYTDSNNTDSNNTHSNNFDFTTVIIKMKRENIEEKLNNDIKKLLFCIYCLSFIPIIDNYQISDVIHNNIHLIQQQTNFHQEIINIQQMRENSKKLKYVKIPNVYSEITLKHPNIILMEYIDGLTLQNIDKSEYDIYAKLLIKFVLVTLFMNGCCHGDLHIGNILFLKDETNNKNKYKIGILDFGIVYEIKTTRDAVFYILSNFCDTTPEELANKILFSGIIEPVECIEKLNKHHYTNITQILSQFINETIHTDKIINPINIIKALKALNHYIVNNELFVGGFRIKPSDDLVKFQVIIAMVQGVTVTLCNNNYIELVNQVMKETFHIDVSES
jgi:predicted unusual protein kinase regulating ubiquinone biosynthesis (AarF/ABC1/UbiB family)